MDPWPAVESQENSPMTFEDNFEPDGKLPDSVEYLANLESKLARLKLKRTKKDLVQSLDETHKSCMVRLLSEGTTHSAEDLLLDAPLNNSNVLFRRLAPERQALTFGELVELLKADQLSEKLFEETEEGDNSVSSAEEKANHKQLPEAKSNNEQAP
ncbi:uncharacterized protein LOC124802502 [Schistocerca piceifrons]|uniref:uncharacterized protein LOC124802502 n=1 Tax=Schistocerca piceifrons TaxID=274613 RepID=UPI001F5F137C|nr:uncharacterized protein LOC124802502 [Schistocerca piceifrons]XP_049939623.1 uncharacterized protein LOC126416129 [Schistocerca serialis cubense]